MPKLTIKSGPAAGRSIPIEGDVVIGRADADLTIEDPELSRRHAVVRLVDGGVQIEDLGSTNGTFVNGERVTKPVTVTTAVSLQLGDSRLDVETEPAAKAPGDGGSRRRLAIALGLLVVVAASAVGIAAVVGGESDETRTHTLRAQATAPSLASPESFQVSGVMTGEPFGRTAVVIQRRLGANIKPGGSPASVRGFLLVTGQDGVLSLNFDGTLAVDRSGRERLTASGVAANGTKDYAGVTGSFRIRGGRSNAGAPVARYRVDGELEY